MWKIKSLSWSKINTFETSRSQFIKTYFEEEPFFETKEILFWKILWTIIELWSFDEDEIIRAISKDRNWEIQEVEDWKVKSYKEIISRISENEDFVEKLLNFQFDLFPVYEQKLQQFIDGICCLGFIDNCPDIVDDWLHTFREFKTWKKTWDQKRADNHWQLYFYALMIEEQSWIIPKTAYLDWIVTSEDENGNIIPTWEIKTFKVDIDPKEVKKWRKRIPKIFKDMNDEYEKWLESQEWQLEIDTSKMKEYAELERQKKDILDKQSILKDEIDKEMKDKKVDSYKQDWIWSFYYIQKKKWDYPEDIISKEESINEKYKWELQEVLILKQEFEEKTEPEVSSTLSFRLWK